MAALISGCSEHQIVNQQKHDTESEKITKDVITSQKASLKDLKLRGKPKTSLVKINGQQFEINGQALAAGSKVYNTSIGEFGYVTGSFIITSPIKPKLDELTNVVAISNIANEQWRVVTSDVNNLLTWYQQLQSLYAQVEMNINYTPRTGEAK
ncbi:MAG: hypothetical protein HRU22_12970 [Gammaproteobacteria bacterium]|nr:hypothetical protein [Gammaproteobacteria bacterium]